MRMMLKLVVRVWLVLCLALAVAGVAHAQDNDTVNNPAATNPAAKPADTPKPVVDAKTAAVVAAALPTGILEASGRAERAADDISRTIEDLKRKLATPSLSQVELAKSREELEKLREQANQSDAELSEPLSQLDQLVSRLGPLPKEGETEPDAVSAQRAKLAEVRNKLLAARAQLALAAGAADQLATQAGQIERSRFRDNLFSKGKSIFQPSLWSQGVAAIPTLWARTVTLFHGFKTRIVEEHNEWTPWFLIVAFVVLLAAGYKACRVLAHKVRSDSTEIGALGKLLRVVAVSLGYALISIVFLLIYLMLYTSAADDEPRLDRLFVAFAVAMIGLAFARGVTRSILSPTRPDWRIANLSDHGASMWLWLITLGIALIKLNEFVSELSAVVNMTGEFLALRQAVLTIILVVIVAKLILSARRDKGSEEANAGKSEFFGWANLLIQPVWLLLLVSIVAMVVGYQTFALYLVSNIFTVGVTVSFLYCLRRLADAFVSQSVSPNSRVSKMLKSAFSMSQRSIQRFGIALNAGVDISILLLGLPILLAVSPLTWVDIRGWISTAFFGFKIGDITISLSAILLAIGVFLCGLLLTRYITSWLDRRILAPTEMDAGVRNSVRTGAGYLATIVALLVAFAAAGVDFGNIAIVAGALSVGIGFGLQSIVNNFVSGLILLAERPIKVGDWVNVSAGEGTVKQINVRSTEIETFDRCSIIVPNSSLISENVQNWTHGDMMGRCKFMVGVSYDADPQQVHDILLKCAEAHPRAVSFPPATVLFKDFGASSLDFEVRVFIDDIWWVSFVASDLRFAIHKELKAAGIEIPFPQQDINVRGLKEALIEGRKTDGRA